MRRAAVAVAAAFGAALLGIGSSAPAAAARASDVPRTNSVQVERDLTYRKVDGSPAAAAGAGRARH